MSQRLNYPQLLGNEVQHLMSIEGMIEKSGLPLNLLEMIKLRASILNGCAYCVRYHMLRLRRQGETEQRIDLVSAWREAPCYTDAEQAALEMTEEITLVSHSQELSDDVYDLAKQHFGNEQLASLVLAVCLINTWNRLAIAFKTDHSSLDYLLALSQEADEAFAAQQNEASVSGNAVR